MMACHINWHSAVYHVEKANYDAALDIFDNQVSLLHCVAFSALTLLVICLEQDADLHMAQLLPLPLTVSCFSKIQIGFTFLVPAHLCSPRKRAVKWVCVLLHCVAISVFMYQSCQRAVCSVYGVKSRYSNLWS